MDLIENFCATNNEYIMTSVTMIIGIFAGWLPALKSKKWKIILTIFLSIIFVFITHFSYSNTKITIIASVLSCVWIISSIILFTCRKGVIKRKKLDRMMREFTSNADREQPICIFGGDLDFFGNCYQTPKNCKFFEKSKYNKNDISKNKQFLQIKKEICFRTVNILSVKPDSNSDNDIMTRRRIGFLKEEFGENLTIKFFQSKECHNCSTKDECTICEVCDKCPDKTNCTHRVKNCEKLKCKCLNMCYNPDTKLRGRFLQKKKDDSMSAAIVTTNKAGKSYILKEYTHGTKEYSIYHMIWDVWWKKCEEDKDFIDQCVSEYRIFMNK